jgi:hypothetical protein
VFRHGDADVGHIHKLHKNGRPGAGSRYFCCFTGNYQRTNIAVAAEILARRRFCDQQNSAMARCFVLFSAVWY